MACSVILGRTNIARPGDPVDVSREWSQLVAISQTSCRETRKTSLEPMSSAVDTFAVLPVRFF